MVDVCLLGCGGSLPTPERGLTSLLVSYNGRKILIDCGEGNQVSMKMVGWGFKNIDVICFTHYHADHVMGLTGLLLTIANSGRELPLTIIGPNGLKEVFSGLTVIAPILPFEVKLVEFDCIDNDNFEDKVFTINDVIISALPVNHSTYCLAYSLNFNRKKRFNPDKAIENNVPKKLWSILQNGNIASLEGKTYTPEMVLGQDRRGIKVSYCTDTRPTGKLPIFVSESDLFICEGMYGEDDKYNKAVENRHMLFSEAAQIAKVANVDELWLTHLSPSLSDPERYLENAVSIFKNTHLGTDRKFKSINFK